MTTMVDLHAKTDPDSFKPEVRNLGIHSAAPTFHLAFDTLRHFGVFLSHDQMVDLRDVLTGAIADSTVKCYHRDCEEEREDSCDCGNGFCWEHGQKHNDRTGPDDGYNEEPVRAICGVCIERSRV